MTNKKVTTKVSKKRKAISSNILLADVSFGELYHYNDLSKGAQAEALKSLSKNIQTRELVMQTLKEVNPTLMIEFKLSGGFMDYLMVEKYKELSKAKSNIG